MILNTDAITGQHGLEPKSIHCIVTSPPYFGLRAYGTTPYQWPEVEYSVLGFPVKIPSMTCELGQEPDHFAFIGHLVLVFRESYRVLRDDGTLWLNMGDSYAGYHGNKNYRDGEVTPSDKPGYSENMRKSTVAPRVTSQKSSTLQGGKKTQMNSTRSHEVGSTPGLKPKDLIGIPWMLAYALRDDGWYLRQNIIWAKAITDNQRNYGTCMPESVQDRFTKSHEDIFLLSKSEKYYFDLDAVKRKATDSSNARTAQNVAAQSGSDRVPGKVNGPMKAKKVYSKLEAGSGSKINGHSGYFDKNGNYIGSEVANKRSVWWYAPAQFRDAHFATYPQDLIVDMIKAGSPVGGVVLDPFLGSGTTMIVARKLDRKAVGIELNPAYARMAKMRLHKELGIFA